MFAKLRKIYSSKGFAGTVLHVVNAPLWRINHYIDHRYFDWKYGVETLQIEKDYLKDIHGTDVGDCSFYEATVWRRFSKSIRSLGIKNSEYLFIDLGSGKGRGLMYAALMNFRKAIGVELSEELHKIAESNILIFGRRKTTPCTFELVCADVTQYRFPDEDLVVFMNNPFCGNIMRRVIENLHEWLRHHGKDLYIVYMNPQASRFLDESVKIKKLSETAAFCIYKNV